MSVHGAQARITAAVTAWAGVTARPHRFGGVEYVIGKREIGHIHGDHLVDIPFPKKVRDEIIHQALLDDLLSAEPSLRAQALAQNAKTIGSAAATGERDKVSAALLERIHRHAQIDYFPPEAILEKYFQDNVIGGSGAFTVVAESHASFGRALTKKLIREIAGLPGVRYAAD